jgi:hypothetical protein
MKLTAKERIVLEVLQFQPSSVYSIYGESETWRSDREVDRVARKLGEKGLVTYHSHAFIEITPAGRSSLSSPTKSR